MSAKNFIVRGGGDFSGIKRELDKTQKQLSNFKSGVSKTMGAIVAIFGAVKLGQLVKESTQLAMGVESAIENINFNLGNNAGAFKTWVDANAKTFGIAQADAYKYGFTFSNMISGFTNDTAKVKDSTIELMKATAIISSKTGRSFDDTANRIRSGMLGSTEAIEDLGVYTQVSMLESTEAFKKFAGDKSWAQLNFQTQQQIRLAAILEQTYTRYGDTMANTTQTRHLSFIASLNNIKLALGNAFLPIYNAILPALTSMATAIANVMNIVAQFATALFGKATPFQAVETMASGAVSSSDDLADAIGGAGSAAKKAGKDAKGALAPFDQLNTLAKKADAGSSGGGGGAGGASGMGLPKLNEGEGLIGSLIDVSDRVKKVADDIKKAWGEITSFFTSNKTAIITALAGIGSAIATYFAAVKWDKIALGLAKVFGPGGILAKALPVISGPAVAIATVVALVVAAIVYLWQTSESFRDSIISTWEGIKETLSLAWDTVIAPILAGFVDMLKGIWNDGIKPLWNKWVPFIEQIILLLLDIWNLALKPVVDFIIKTFGPVVAKVFGGAFTSIKDFVVGALVKLGEWLTTGTDIIKKVREVLAGINTFVSGVFSGDWSKAWDGIKTIFSTFGINIDEKVEGVKRIFGGITKFVSSVFAGDWKTAWDGIKTSFKSVWESFEGIAKKPINTIIRAFNKLISGVNRFKINIPSWAAGLAGLAGFSGGSIGFSIPMIPELAQGGFVGANNPRLAIIGDNTREGEIVTPESKIYDQMVRALKDSGGMGSNVVLEIDGIQFGRVSANSINKAQRYAGVSLVEV